MTAEPEGYLGAGARITSGPAPELVEAGYAVELADAPLLHRGLGLADLAQVVALSEARVLPAAETARLLPVLLELLDVPAERFPYDPVYGDAYNSRERELERRLGTTAGWVHTGRTRREAGRIAFRLALRARLLDLHEAVGHFVASVARRADELADAVWADSTYLQPAQPSTFGHYLGAFGQEAVRHLDRIEAAYRWADTSPGGVGGVAGTRVPVDRDRLAALLGFAAPGPHTRDAMWATDGLVDAVLAASQAATTVDRLAEDLEIFTSPGFGYVTLDTALCRASVLLPQKRNPYALAVIRSGAGTLVGRVTGLLVTQRSPSARTDNWLRAYGEVAGSVELGRQVVALGERVVATLAVDRRALAERAGEHFTGATDLAEALVLRHGLDYRSAYRVTGRAVATAITAGGNGLTAADITAAAAEMLGRPLDVDPALVAEATDPACCALNRDTPGGSAPRRVREHCQVLAERVAAADAWRRERRNAAEAAETALLAAARRLATPVIADRS
ncbi:MAG TPA: lyase family protein [Pseudonocardiaceae bacterium]